MKKHLLLLFSLLSSSICLFAGWTNKNTAINDHLTGVAFWGNNGIVSGKKGVYFTTNGGNGSSSWTRFNIAGNSSDSMIYNNSKFTHAFSDPTISTNHFFACGTDTINNTAVIIMIDLPSLLYSIIFVGPPGTALNRIGYHSQSLSYYAVGNNGLIVNFSNILSQTITTGISYNLKSISFFGSNFCMGANGVNINGNNNSNNFTFNITNTTSYNYNDVVCTGSNSGFGVGSSYYKWNSNYPTDQPNYDYGLLDAQVIINYSNLHFVGTTHGIFRSDNTLSFLEYQPTSLNYKINAFWNSAGSSALYACGDNGTLLSTSDLGGLPKPIAILNLQGVCKSSNLLMTAITGSSTNCQWLLNNVLINSSCGTFNHYFAAAGTYTVQLNVSNGPGSYDTAIEVINIVNPPVKNLPVATNTSVICNQGPLLISINNSELNVMYTLKKFGSPSLFGTSGAGNGSILNFTSNILTQAGDYYLSAQSTIAQCVRDFTDTIHLDIDKTKAEFYSTLQNVSPGENFICYQKCTDAQNYNWNFSPFGIPSTTSTPDPIVSLGSLGLTQIQLKCWSNNGCYDSITKIKPVLYNEPAPLDSCWTMINNGTDPTWQGYYTNDISDIVNLKKGFLCCGHFENETLSSRYGDSMTIPATKGAFLSRYSKNGALKWLIYSRQISSSPDEEFISAAEDSRGNIYAISKVGNILFDNTGDSAFATGNCLIKFDSTGKLIWFLQLPALTKIKIDKNDNILAVGLLHPSVTLFTLGLNGVITDTILNSLNPSSTYCLIKINNNGTLLWYAPINISFSTYAKAISNISIDHNNNILLGGTYINSAGFFSAGTSNYSTLTAVSGYPDEKGFVAKFDSLGILKWTVNTYTQGSTYNKTYINDIVSDSTGNCFITGQNNYTWTNCTQHFLNADGSITSANLGPYFIAKINPNGVCTWIQGRKVYSFGGATSTEGFKIDIKGNLIQVLGVGGPVFSSANNDTIVYSVSNNDYFIAHYDTLGNIIKLKVNGTNQNGIADHGFTGFFSERDGSCYISRNFGTQSVFNNFGTSINNTNGTDGTITRVSGNCGITIYPNSITTHQQQKLLYPENIRVFPNPSNGIFSINFDSDRLSQLTITVSNQLGQLIHSSKVSTKKIPTIDLNGHAAGIYLLSVQTDSGIFYTKICIQ